MRRGNRIGRVRRLCVIRSVLSTACNTGGRMESRQATAFDFKAHLRVERRRPSRRLERLLHAFTSVRLEPAVTGRTGVAA
jgi:hypothetical protein